MITHLEPVNEVQCAETRTTLEFRLFGAFAVRSNDGWNSGPAPKKGRELIEYLALYPRRLATQDDLAAAFWPALDTEAVGHRIHLAASGARVFLRALFGGVDALQCVNGSYRWNPTVRVVSDVERFLDCGRRATVDAFRTALDLYSGDFLAGEMAEWLQPTRIRVASVRACALEALAKESLAHCEYATALSFGLDLIEAERGHESGARLVMQCFAALGLRARVLEQYLLLKAYLAEQIGVDPTEETAELARRLVGSAAVLGAEPRADRQPGRVLGRA